MKKVLERIKNLNILVFGDVMLDRYVNGEVSRISPEAPVPVIRVREEKSVAGGAANVALNLASLGASVESVGWFGKDEQGDELVEILSEKNIKVDPRCRFSSAPTISKSRITSSNQQICRVDRESNAEHTHWGWINLVHYCSRKQAMRMQLLFQIMVRALLLMKLLNC